MENQSMNELVTRAVGLLETMRPGTAHCDDKLVAIERRSLTGCAGLTVAHYHDPIADVENVA